MPRCHLANLLPPQENGSSSLGSQTDDPMKDLRDGRETLQFLLRGPRLPRLLAGLLPHPLLVPLGTLPSQEKSRTGEAHVWQGGTQSISHSKLISRNKPAAGIPCNF